MAAEGDAVVARAGDHVITLGDLHKRLKRAGRMDLVREAALEAVIDAEIAARGVTVDVARLQSAADGFRESRKLYRAEDTHEWLKTNGFSIDDFEAALERELLVAELKRQAVDDEAVAKRFAESRAALGAARVSVMEVETEAQAEEAKLQIVEEEATFEDLARRLSLDEDMRGAGGYLGWVRAADVDEGLLPLVMTAEADDIVGPARSGAGWALVKVWETAQAELDDVTTSEIRGALFGEWLEARLRDARIDSPLLAANER